MWGHQRQGGAQECQPRLSACLQFSSSEALTKSGCLFFFYQNPSPANRLLRLLKSLLCGVHDWPLLLYFSEHIETVDHMFVLHRP